LSKLCVHVFYVFILILTNIIFSLTFHNQTYLGNKTFIFNLPIQQKSKLSNFAQTLYKIVLFFLIKYVNTLKKKKKLGLVNVIYELYKDNHETYM